MKQFVAVIRERCLCIKVDVIEEREIEQMNMLINEKSSEMVAFKGTLLLHQVTDSASIPNQPIMKSLCCFCDPDGCDHYKLGSVKYKKELPIEHLNTSAVFTDSEDDTMPLSTNVSDNTINSSLNCDLFRPGVSEYE